MQYQWFSHSVEQTQQWAAAFAEQCLVHCSASGIIVTLEGELGAGKTALSQGLIRSLLPNARVKSPTFSLLESYQLRACSIHHLDLYRLHDPEELEYLGLRDLFWHNLCLIEWASKGQGWLPVADVAIEIQYEGSSRRIQLQTQTENGHAILQALMS
jgi:tRNA threonylcarbamoyladenosine biosynthesis protein TsaE